MSRGIIPLVDFRYPQMPLTEVAVRNARADDKPRKLFDAHSLFLFVTPQGGKLWRLKYRFAGKEKLLSFFVPFARATVSAARGCRRTCGPSMRVWLPAP